MRCTILLVMCEPERKYVEHVLVASGYDIYFARDSESVVSQVKTGKICCAVIDENIFGEEWASLAQSILEEDPNIGVVVVGKNPRELSAKINGTVIWDVVPRSKPSKIKKSVDEACELLAMSKGQVEVIAAGLEEEAAKVKMLATDALNCTGIYKGAC